MDDSIDLNPFRRRLLKRGESADARVLEVDVPKYQSPGTSLTHKFVLEVQPAGADPFEAQVKDVFSVFWAPKRGDLLKVRFSPRSHKVAFDLEGDPRYDASMQQQTGRWTPGEAPPPSIFGTSSTAGGAASTAERLRRLGELRDAGVITAEEFEAQKLRILETL
ncbi:MAG: hypothetical protein QOH43_3532 [Solirubrobacteraceae bacterium]|nr:hypothetical protein [Solirubrobacteraceae bacterium]